MTNDGIVEGVWMFCRHGDRVPGRCLSPAHRAKEEAAFWMTRLPYPDSEAAFEAFSKRFPLDVPIGTNQGSFLDVKRNPFGFLTQSGLEQLRENGRRFFNRYSQHGHHLPDQKEWRGERAQDFMCAWDISVYSTNYLRTVMSVQSFLGERRRIDSCRLSGGLNWATLTFACCSCLFRWTSGHATLSPNEDQRVRPKHNERRTHT